MMTLFLLLHTLIRRYTQHVLFLINVLPVLLNDNVILELGNVKLSFLELFSFRFVHKQLDVVLRNGNYVIVFRSQPRLVYNDSIVKMALE